MPPKKSLILEIIEGNCIPIEYFRELPEALRRPLIIFAQLIIVSTFVYFTYSSYLSQLTSPFISLEKSAGICRSVSKSVTGSFLISDLGYWEGSIYFQSSQALIGLSLRNLEVNQQEWSHAFQDVKLLLAYAGQGLLQYQSLAWNVIFLMEGVQLYNVEGYLQKLYFAAAPSAVFHSENIYAGVASARQVCLVPLVTSFNQGNSQLTLSIAYETIANQCSESIDPLIVRSYDNRAITELQFDMNAYSTAVAINMGYLDVSLLEEIPFSSDVEKINYFVFDSFPKALKLRQFVNTRHPGMQAILCLVNEPFETEDLFICMIRTGSILYLPVMNHFGGEEAQYFGNPQPCLCEMEIGQSHSCDAYDLLPALIFDGKYHSWDDVDAALEPLVGLVAKYKLSVPDDTSMGFYYTLTTDAYAASLSVFSSYFGSSSILADSRNRSKAFEFCGFNCSIFTFRFEDPGKSTITPMGYSLFDGSCSPFLNLDHWDRVSEIPPQSLTEIYYTCTETWYNAVYNALGVSMGIASLIVSAIAVFFLPIYLNHQFKVSKVHNKAEIELESSNRQGDNPNLKEELPAANVTVTWTKLSVQLSTLRESIQSKQIVFNPSDPLHQLAMCLPSFGANDISRQSAPSRPAYADEVVEFSSR